MGIICSSNSARKGFICYCDKENERNKTKKIKNLQSIEEDKKLNNFLNVSEFQRDFYKITDDNDNSFNILKEEEEKQLKEEFQKIKNKKNDFKNIKDKFKFDFQNDNKNNNLILHTINNENTENIYKKKIIEEIKTIKGDDSKYEIEYLTILLIGRKGIGKSTLINYILEAKTKHNEGVLITNSSDGNYTIYKKKSLHLQLIEFKPFGLSETPEKVGKKTVEYIKRLVNSEKTNYNDFVHSIWFCIYGTRLEQSESEIFKNLKNVYKDNIMPIIFVYLQTIDEDAANEMGNYIGSHFKNYKGINFIKVLAEKTETLEAFGKDNLLKETMERCTKALQGEMIKLMTQKISKDVENIMLKNNEKNRTKVKECIINEFIENYKIVKTNKDFIGYIIEILTKNLLKFYEKYKESISNNTLILLKNSDLIKEVKKCIKAYKNDLKEKMKSIVENKAKDFICLQAEKEKLYDNMSIEHKRRLKGFIKTNKKYFKQNYYFICQKYIFNEIIQKFMIEYFMEIKNKIDEIINDLLKNKDEKENEKKNEIKIESENDKRNEEIQFYLEDCFLNKLKNFSEKVNIHLKIDRNITKTDLETPGEFDNEINKIESINESYISSNIDEEESSFLKDEDLKIKNDMNLSLDEFFQKNTIQDTYFNQEAQDDQVFKILKEHIKNDLINYVYSHKDYINSYNYKTMTYDKNPISKIIGSKETLKIYKEKIKNEFKKIENNIDTFKIKYLSIIIIGRSGVGKSTLINCLLKEDLAKEGTGKIITIENASYHNDKIPFLRLIDTRGIEFEHEFGPKSIMNNALGYIKNEKNQENQDYNNYINCVWFCLKGNDIEEKEIEIINNLQKKESNLPIIVVNTLKYEKEENSQIKRKILEKCTNIKFTQLLARSTSDEKCLSYGLDNLLKLTLEVCNNVSKGDSFNKMKEEITKTIKNNFIMQNRIIKENIKKEIIPIFLNYDKYLRSDDYKKYIFNYLEKIFLEFLKVNKEGNNELFFENKDEINNFKNVDANIQGYIDFYERETNQFINSIKNDKTIEYLDFQVGIEKKEKKNIKIENKNTKKGFNEIIQIFLNNNFHFIAQKHYLDYINKDISESFINYIGDEIIKKVEFLLKNESEDLFKNIYKKKFEDFKNWINNYRKNNNNIYNSLINTSVIQENINNGKGENNSSSRKISERSGKTSNKNSPTIKVSGIKASINSLKGNNYDKKNENNTSLNNISGKQEKQEKISKNNDSNIETPDIKVSLNTITGNNYVKNSVNAFNETKKPEERELENPSDGLMGPPPNI